MEEEYENAFREASSIIASMKRCIEHEWQRCMEEKGKYLLLVQWERLEDHIVGFKESYRFYDPFPVVEHFERVSIKTGKTDG